MSRGWLASAGAGRSRGLLAAALARAESWLLEPAPPLEAAKPTAAASRPVVVVAGVARGCGASTVARALAAELALRDPCRAAVVAGPRAHAALPFGTPAAARLARAVAERAGVEARPSGRLCVADSANPALLEHAVRGLAPLVFDAEPGGGAGAAASLAARTVAVATPAVEPALAALVAASLARVGPEPLIALNRAPGEAAPAPAWDGRADALLPESRAGARMALAGRGAGGALGAAIAELADRCEEW